MPERDVHRSEEARKLGQLIRGIRVAMLTTVDGAELRSRPMVTLDTPFDGTLWFFTRRRAVEVGGVRAERRVNVTFADPESERYVSMTGHASVVRDPSKNRRLWSPALASWFPAGPEDRELALLAIRVDQAEYWDAHAASMVRLKPEPAAPPPYLRISEVPAPSTLRSRTSTAR